MSDPPRIIDVEGKVREWDGTHWKLKGAWMKIVEPKRSELVELGSLKYGDVCSEIVGEMRFYYLVNAHRKPVVEVLNLGSFGLLSLEPSKLVTPHPNATLVIDGIGGGNE